MPGADDLPLTERQNPRTGALDELATLDLVRLLDAENRAVLPAVEEAAPDVARAIDAIAARLRGGGRLHYFGAGTSGRLAALDAAECHPTFGTPPELVQAHIAGGEAALRGAVEGAEDDGDAGAREARTAVRAGDAVVGISASGGAPYVVGALRASRALGALTVAVQCVEGGELAAAAELRIVAVVGPEAIAGSTRLKAGTAQKLILNALSTGTMVRLGKVYGNLMVDVRAVNAKLRARAIRLVRTLARCDDASARSALAHAGWDVKVAVVALHRGIDAESARTMLQESGGSLRSVLEEP
ncbi:MAG TPA: N-acetylmuramic acid 6-phosphate etherase [Candidatus Dormibacteraeota bacterium]|nr:N-acetylmuramic acid 6-phosphate etherase [Candidatus Dormibacteraeota bacterium]